MEWITHRDILLLRFVPYTIIVATDIPSAALQGRAHGGSFKGRDSVLLRLNTVLMHGMLLFIVAQYNFV